jgi:serine/threonine-protein kinase
MGAFRARALAAHPMPSHLRSELESTFRGQYAIERELAGGGMARVFVATDNALGRRVVIKVLSPDLAASVSVKRFEREIRLTASLQQANIVPVLSAGEAGGLPLYTMPFVEGLSLREQLAREGRPPLTETISVLRDVARALAYAHERGVVHRDIKPQNILLSGGAAVVTDFGIAKALANARVPNGSVSSSTSTVTQLGTAVGTPAYMAPEQISGDPEIDHRADLYSFGCLAYELLTGQPPFGARPAHALLAAHLAAQPAPVGEPCPECPPPLARIVMRCLEKDRAARPRSAREILATLDTVATAATPFERFLQRRTRRERMGALSLAAILVLAAVTVVVERRSGGQLPRIQSLAVLPLENLSGDSEQDYFADGMTDALITDLARLGGLKRVTARGSVTRYKGTTKSFADIARELKVEALVTGSVLRSGNRVSISAQLINPATEDQLWTNRYERDLQNVLVLRNEMVSAIVRELRVQLTPGEQTRLASAGPVSSEAYEAYLKGRFHWFKMNRRDFETAMNHFQLALEKDPNYALAHVGISYTWAARAQLGMERPHKAYANAKVAALKALELDDGLGEAHSVLATVLFAYEHDWPAGEREFRRAIELNPNDANPHAFYGLLLAWTGRLEDGRAQLQRALELDPYNAFYQWQVGFHLLMARQYDQAIAQFRKVLEAEPDNGDANIFLIVALHQKGMHEEALALRKSRATLSGDQAFADALDRGYAQGGYRAALRLAAATLVARSRQGYVNPYAIAELYALAGEKDHALKWLATAYQERAGQILFIKVYPVWDPLRDDPRFQAVLRKVNFPS